MDFRGYCGDLWGWRQIFPHGNENEGKNSRAGTSERGTEKLPPHIPRPVDIPMSCTGCI
ncbi:hypothetical protein A2U01_0068281 [Trifolium medium]|uniref:Uncharacterized protein n=1 Tax=Trifolium medium TaxID=97028 RepID=A0A392SGE7_9FABA|nr:hypothetical protein [Trifolium medium]